MRFVQGQWGKVDRSMGKGESESLILSDTREKYDGIIYLAALDEYDSYMQIQVQPKIFSLSSLLTPLLSYSTPK